ncbi:hypothetical protein [Parasphingorhabdus sp.]|uniref:hypothetical protein n=1 Tax=Parasphingorhabdus sp. TaxID=2709688 RepID=UPI003C75BD44
MEQEMITGLAYAIILMGCSDDMTMCREIVRDNRAFATLRECEKAQEDALRSNIALEIDYPVVATKCTQGSYRFTQTGAAYIGQ